MLRRKFVASICILAMVFSLIGTFPLASFADGEGKYVASVYEASEVKVVQEGNAINDFQLGFKKPAMSEAEETLSSVFSGWLMMYSSESIDGVWSFLTTLSDEEILELSQTSGANRMYRITNYGWADGVGNTFRAGQKDVITGADFGPGLYTLYVATYTTNGIVALAQADRQVDIFPTPKHVRLVGQGKSIDDYAVNFESFNDARLTHNFVFYSKDHLYKESVQSVRTMTLSEIQALAAQNRGKLVVDKTGPVSFNKKQRDLNGDTFGKDVYNVYVASVGENGVFGVSYAVETIITAPLPKAQTKSLNGGKGTIFAIGGATDKVNYQFVIDEMVKSASKTADVIKQGDKHSKIASEFGLSIAELARQNGQNNPNRIIPGKGLAIGQSKPRIAILSSSRDNLDTVLNHFYFDDPQYGSLEKDWIERGFEPVYIPLSIDSAYFVANHAYYAALIKTCDAVWLQGGDQNKHAKSLLNDDGSDTEIMKALRYVYNRGGMIAGTSAGMHVMSQPAFGYGTPDVVLQTNKTEHYSIADIPTTGDLFPAVDNNNLTVPGANLMPTQVLNDTHFDARGRLGRLLVALRDTGKTIGIGSDEGTGIAIRDGVGTVNGNQGVFIVDVSGAIYTPAGAANTFGVTGVKLHYLTHGDTYNFDTKEIIVASDKVQVVESGTSVYQTEDVFGPYNTTKTMISLVNSTVDSASRAVKSATSPVFKVTFAKALETEAYGSGVAYVDSRLDGYTRTTIIGMTLSVEENVVPEFGYVSISTGKSDSTALDYSATITFNNPLAVGFTSGSGAKYLNDSEPVSYFVDVKRGEVILTQASSSLKIVNDVKLEIVLATDDFAAGDIILVKTTLMDAFDQTLSEPLMFIFDGSDWVKTLVETGISRGRANGSGTSFAATITFTNSLKVRYVGSTGSFLNDSEEPEEFVEIKRGDVTLAQGSSSLKIVENMRLEIVLAGTNDFEMGDSIIIKGAVFGALDEAYPRETLYVFDGTAWVKQ